MRLDRAHPPFITGWALSRKQEDRSDEHTRRWAMVKNGTGRSVLFFAALEHKPTDRERRLCAATVGTHAVNAGATSTPSAGRQAVMAR